MSNTEVPIQIEVDGESAINANDPREVRFVLDVRFSVEDPESDFPMRVAEAFAHAIEQEDAKALVARILERVKAESPFWVEVDQDVD